EPFVLSTIPRSCDPAGLNANPVSWQSPAALVLAITWSPATVALSNRHDAMPASATTALPVVPQLETQGPRMFCVSVVAIVIAVDGAPVTLTSKLGVVPVTPSLGPTMTVPPPPAELPLPPPPVTTCPHKGAVRTMVARTPKNAIFSFTHSPRQLTR